MVNILRVSILGFVLVIASAIPAYPVDVSSIQEIREKYSLSKHKLESIMDIQMHYAFEETIKRYDIPEVIRNRVKESEHRRVDGYLKGDRIRIDVFDDSESDKPQTIFTILAGKNSFEVRQNADKEFMLTSSGEDRNPRLRATGRASSFIEGAYRLPLQLDVRQIVLGADYELSLSKAPHSVPTIEQGVPTVSCEFRRVIPPAPVNGHTELYAASGSLVFLPDRDWAVGKYSFVMNSGLKVDGNVDYQDIQSFPTRAVPQRLRFVMTPNGQGRTGRTEYALDGIIMRAEPVPDRMFTLEAFGLGIQESHYAYFLVSAGVLALFVAIILRARGQRKAKTQPIPKN
jgi:predicted acetyltransferase